MAQAKKAAKSKDKALYYAAFGGLFGADRFYLGYPIWGAVKLCTFGGCGILWFMDVINIESGRLQPADGSKYIEDKKAAQADKPKNKAKK